MLRAAMAASPGGSAASSASSATAPLQLPDLEQLLQQRNRLLAERRRERADMQVASARSQLVAAVLGSWKGAPKAARDEFERYMRGELGCCFLIVQGWSSPARNRLLAPLRRSPCPAWQGQLAWSYPSTWLSRQRVPRFPPCLAPQPCRAAVAVLLGGESSSEEVAAAAVAAWRALCAHPPNTDRGRGAVAALQPARCCLPGASAATMRSAGSGCSRFCAGGAYAVPGSRLCVAAGSAQPHRLVFVAAGRRWRLSWAGWRMPRCCSCPSTSWRC